MNRQEIISDIISKSQPIIESTIDVELNNYIMNDMVKLLDNEYLNESKTYEEQLFNADCWGGGVWDLIYHNYKNYRPFLVLNYTEREDNTCLSPVMQDFEYDKLNNLCVEGLKKIKNLK